MRASAVLALGAYAAVARADEAVESVASAIASRPSFSPLAVSAPFWEQFEDDKRWKASHAKKENTAEEWQYVGTWNVEEPTHWPGIVGDKGLVLKDKAAHHAISSLFDAPITNKGDTLVVQYEVKLQNSLECGGAYMKLLQDSAALKSDEFSNASPYIIMFGPDRCGSTNKVHFIFRHKNPSTGVYEEKHMNAAPAARLTRVSTVYTLIVNPDQTFDILIDGESARSGSLLDDDFDPPVNPAKEINDPDDTKPEDWIDEAQIDDPSVSKPADWDEEAPYEIVDTEAVKPADWLDDEPLTIPDPEAVKPEDWDDEEDGDWIAPAVANPKCDEVSGCGPWTQPLMRNPEFKGKWKAPRIENPAYKGAWKPRTIPNPAYFEDSTPADFEAMGGIGFELWTMQNDILFDNIYIGHSVADAERIRSATWAVKQVEEKELETAAKATKDAETASKTPPRSPLDLNFLDDPVHYVKEKFELFVTLAKRDPIQAAQFVPEVAIGLGVGAVTLLLTLVGLVAGGAKAAPSKEQIQTKAAEAKAAAAKTKDQVAEAVASGADKAKDEVNKRTTRSAAQ